MVFVLGILQMSGAYLGILQMSGACLCILQMSGACLGILQISGTCLDSNPERVGILLFILRLSEDK